MPLALIHRERGTEADRILILRLGTAEVIDGAGSEEFGGHGDVILVRVFVEGGA